jgi:hypothetical protein
LPFLALVALSTAAPGQVTLTDWRLTEEAVIGKGPTPAELLTFVGGLAIAPDLSAYVLLPDDARVQVYDRAGKFLRTIGRKGQGPGELEQPLTLGLVGDTLWILDATSRVSLFSRSGVFHRSFTARVSSPTNGASTTPLAVLADGALLWRLSLRPNTAAGAPVPRMAFVTTTAAGVIKDTIASFDSVFLNLLLRTATSGSSRAQPFSNAPIHTVGPDGARVVIADNSPAATRSDAAYGVTTWSPRGQVTTRRYPYSPREVTTADVARAVGTRPDGSLTPAAAAVRAAMFVPDYFPPLISVLAGRDGTVWVSPRGDDANQWIMVDSTGVARGRVKLEARDQLLQADRISLWVARYPGDGDPVVVRMRIQE